MHVSALKELSVLEMERDTYHLVKVMKEEEGDTI